MAKSSADNQELRWTCEAAIEGTKQSVVMSILVAKNLAIRDITHMLGRDGVGMGLWEQVRFWGLV
ncbi:hypothetical protein C1H46_017443 [Malus baccata]|uniref:Uncharacterized protein n=1 Tax=Malus baccata TaxID=106549 RepID=A0A540MDZ5_MALBA|nr:hypothetical protein C1H46_017443 [Malus baccata]